MPTCGEEELLRPSDSHHAPGNGVHTCPVSITQTTEPHLWHAAHTKQGVANDWMPNHSHVNAYLVRTPCKNLHLGTMMVHQMWVSQYVHASEACSPPAGMSIRQAGSKT